MTFWISQFKSASLRRPRLRSRRAQSSSITVKLRQAALGRSPPCSWSDAAGSRSVGPFFDFSLATGLVLHFMETCLPIFGRERLFIAITPFVFQCRARAHSSIALATAPMPVRSVPMRSCWTFKDFTPRYRDKRAAIFAAALAHARDVVTWPRTQPGHRLKLKV